MSAKALSEYTGKELLYKHLHSLDFVAKPQAVPLSEFSDFDEAVREVQWIQQDQVIKSISLQHPPTHISAWSYQTRSTHQASWKAWLD